MIMGGKWDKVGEETKGWKTAERWRRFAERFG
jgi:hypothetical protein